MSMRKLVRFRKVVVRRFFTLQTLGSIEAEFIGSQAYNVTFTRILAKALRTVNLAFEQVRLLTIFLVKLVDVLMIVASEPVKSEDNSQEAENGEVRRSPVINIG